MAEDLGRLVLKLEADNGKLIRQLESANKKIDRFARSAQSGVDKAKKAFLGLVAGVSVFKTFDKLVSEGRTFAILDSQLKTATGSAEEAAAAFSELEKFAERTPYALEQSVTAFTKLTNLGLTPSIAALESYGNTASAMGKDLNQMIEAVADATTGEFERLKEFGIKAKSEGENVSFTFQGVTTTVRKNAAEIEQYLLGIGNTQFAGAMSERVKTLDGAISNLADTWDALFRNVMRSGVGKLMAGGFNLASSALKQLMDLLRLTPEAAEKPIHEITQAAYEYGQAQFMLEQVQKRLIGIEQKRSQVLKNITDEKARARVDQGFNETIILEKKNIEEYTAAMQKAIAKVQEWQTGIMPAQVKEIEFSPFIQDSIMADSLEARAEMMAAHQEQVLNTIREYNRLTAEEEEQHWAGLVEMQAEWAAREQQLDQQRFQAKMSIASNMLGALADLVSGKSRSSFEAAKKLAYAETLVSTYAAAQLAYYRTLQIPGLGLFAAQSAAAAAVLQGLARAKAISQTSYNGGGGASAAAGAGGAVPTYNASPATGFPRQQQQSEIKLILDGEVLGRVVVDGLMIASDRDEIIFRDGASFNRVAVSRN